MTNEHCQLARMLDLDSIEARAAAASPGPWSFYLGDLWRGVMAEELERADRLTRELNYSDEAEDIFERSGHVFLGDPERPEDAEFVAHARQDVPALVAEVRALRAITQRLIGERDDAVDQAEEAERIIPRPEAMTEWFTAYGVQLMTVGEDGDWLALGHVEPRRMVAAMRKAARDELRLDDEEVFGDRTLYRDGDIAVVEHLRAYFTEHEECGWWAHWGDDDQAHKAAVDVTVWRL